MARIPRVMVTADWLQQARGADAQPLSPPFNTEQVHRLTHVLRLTAGDEVEVFADGDGAWRGRLTGDAVVGWRLAAMQALAGPVGLTHGTLTVACGWPRAKRADFLVEKLVELGVDVLQPVVYERSERGERFGVDKAARYERIIAKACEQSRRNVPLRLMPALSWTEFLAVATGRRLLATGAGDNAAAPCGAISSAAGEYESITVAVGPEGGLTAAEIAAGLQAGFHAVRLGSLTLRVETAAIAAAAAVQLARVPDPVQGLQHG